MSDHDDTAERIWTAYRAAYGSRDKDGAVRSGMLAWTMLGDVQRRAFAEGVRVVLERAEWWDRPDEPAEAKAGHIAGMFETERLRARVAELEAVIAKVRAAVEQSYRDGDASVAVLSIEAVLPAKGGE